LDDGPGSCHYCKDILKYDHDDELEALVVVVRLLAAGAIVVVGGPLAVVATVAVAASKLPSLLRKQADCLRTRRKNSRSNRTTLLIRIAELDHGISTDVPVSDEQEQFRMDCVIIVVLNVSVEVSETPLLLWKQSLSH